MTEATLTRTQLLQAAAAAGFAFAGPMRFAQRALKGSLRIIQWNHFVPAYDTWLDTWAADWGAAHDINVTIDRVDYTRLPALAAAEASAGKGHDVFGFRTPSAAFEPYLVDHGPIVREIERRVGAVSDIGRLSTYNPGKGTYNGVALSFSPAAFIWRHDVWNEVGDAPATWEHVRAAAPRLQAVGSPVGLGLSAALESQLTLLGLMLCFGCSLQDENNRPALGGKQLVEAVKLVADVFRSEPQRVLGWTDASNNAFLLGGQGSAIVNAVTAVQLADDLGIAFAPNLWVWPAPAGPSARVSIPQATGVYSIWKFAKNQDAAQQFLVDLAAQSQAATVASRFLDLPAFPGSFPTLGQAAARVDEPPPKGKYTILTTIAAKHTRSVGYPGTANAAVMKALDSSIVSRMFASAAQGTQSAESAVAAASREVQALWVKSRATGQI
jgi:multiple sugar transport system substrate-binding protein